MISKRKVPKRRASMAKALGHRLFRQRVVANKKKRHPRMTKDQKAVLARFLSQTPFDL